MKHYSVLTLMAFILFPLIKLLGQTAGPGDPLKTGTMSGVVRTYEGKPASHFLVEIIGASRTSTRRKLVVSDDEGRFSASGLEYGDYVIAPYLEGVESRYPAGSSSFYEPSPIRIQIDKSKPNKQISVSLRAPNRILSGTVTSTDGLPVLSIIQVEVQSDADRFVRFSSTKLGLFQVLIPPKTALFIKVTAAGYSEVTQSLAAIDKDIDPQVNIQLQRSSEK